MTNQWNDASAQPASTPNHDYPVSLRVRYPEPGELNRLLIFVKWLLIIPHSIVLMFLTFGLLFATFCAWWAILFTGRYPRGLFDLVVGVQQWSLRASAYSTLLVTDRYPPFSFDRPLSGGAIAVLVLGALLVLGFVVSYFVLLAIVFSGIAEGIESGQFSTPVPGRSGVR